jgi:4-hydroxy-tetrahydrodipicolinate synthase
MNGLFVPLITPFETDGEIAYGALERLAHDVLDEGAAGVVALGTTGEPSSLSPAERGKVSSLIAEVCRGRGASLLMGSPEAVGLDGVTASLTLVPPFVRPGEEGVIAHLTAVAAASPVPLIVYHVPYRTGQPLSASAIRRIAAIPGVIGMKLTTGSIDAVTIDLTSAPPADFAVLCGDDALLSPLLALGAAGAIAAAAHVRTSAYASLIAQGPAGADVAQGRLVARLSLALFAEPNPTVIKGVLHAQGRIPTPEVRLPLLPASRESIDSALALLQ